MFKNNKLSTIAGWIVFAVAFVVYFLSAERTGSLWDCGEFILGAYKLQVVHPPGAPLFMIIGRLFTVVAELFSSNPEDIAFAVNLMSGMCTAFAAAFVSWTTSIFARRAVKAEEPASNGQEIAIAGAGLVAGLIGAFSTSIWFSAVEGEVYAMSTFFTMMTVWAASKWYSLEDTRENDRWLVFSLFAAGLSVGVHLLSLLALPAIGLLFYYKKFKKHNILGALLSIFGGVVFMVFIQKIVIVGVPGLWWTFEKIMVNNLGMPFHSGLIPTVGILGLLAFLVLRLAHKRNFYYIQLFTVVAMLNVIAFSLIGVIVIRANADTPVNMNVPSDAPRLLPYLNREQYGERPLLYGPHFDAKVADQVVEKRYGRVGDKYVHTSDKITQIFKNKDKMLFPRVADMSPARKGIYRMWWGKERGKPTQAFNMRFMYRYQLGWMYTRYFMWNFVGRQNGNQGYFPWDKSSGHWRSGIDFIDQGRLYDFDLEPTKYANSKSNNNYYFIPFILGFIGLIFHFTKNKKDFSFLLMLFIITGIGIIIYSNQPPNEPRERDYVLVGSFLTFAMWAGMAVVALFNMLQSRVAVPKQGLAAGVFALCMFAPIIMLQQNFDDHDRSGIKASRDYATNFLNSVKENAIIFTYGDNDTYPLWYAQEVEGVRPDVRVVNLSLIAVDWYIEKLRKKVNDSPPLKLTISEDSYRGFKRNVIPFNKSNQLTDLNKGLEIANSKKRLPGYTSRIEGYWPSKRMMIRPNRDAAVRLGMISATDTTQLEPIIFDFSKKQLTYKDETAVMDVIASNIWERPVYFSITCENSKLLGINDYTQLEGLALRIVPFKSNSNSQRGIGYSGKVNLNDAYENIMTKWNWGNFDKEELFVDDSYGAALNAMRTSMVRVADGMYNSGQVDKAVAISKKYFEAFPHMNFEYSYEVLPFVEVLVKAKQDEEAKKIIKIMIDEAAENLDFLVSLDEETLKNSYVFQSDFQKYGIVVRRLDRMIAMLKDSQLTEVFNTKLGGYTSGGGVPK